MATIDLGKIKMVWRGAYNNATAYTIDDVVSLSGTSYICIAATTGNTPPNATYWNVLAQGGTDLGATLSNNQVAIKNNSGNIAGVNIGTAGQVFKVNSGANGYEFGTISSDFVKLGSVSATGSASSITLDNLFTSDYDIYKIYYINMNPASGIDHTQFRMRLLDASGGEITTTNYMSGYEYHYINSGSNTWSQATEWNSGHVRLHRDHIGQASDNYKSHEMEMTLYNPLSTSYKTSFYWNCNADDGGGTSEYQNFGRGFVNLLAANRGIKFYTYDGDNIDANAKVTMYGIKN